LGENVEDQAGAVDHPAFGQLLEIALLYRAERVVDENDVGVERGAVFAQFLSLSGTDEIAWTGSFDARGETADDARAGRARQLGEFVEGKRIGTAWRLRLQQERALAFSGSLKQRTSPACCGTPLMRPTGRFFKGRRGAPQASPPSSCTSGAGACPPWTTPSGPPTRTFRDGTTVEIACL
jgi:hypothetical protein